MAYLWLTHSMFGWPDSDIREAACLLRTDLNRQSALIELNWQPIRDAFTILEFI